MILDSELVQELNHRAIQVVVFSPAADDPALTSRTEAGTFEAENADFRVSKLTHGQVAEFRRYFREPMRDNAALWSRHLYNQNSPKLWIRWRARVMLALHDISFRSRIVQSAFAALDRFFHRSNTIRKQLQEMEPDLVVATYPVSSFETTCLLEARRLGVPVVGHLLSWDNITCKGRFVLTPKHFITWGPIMNEELDEFYGIDDQHAYPCGVPHFDAHLKLVDGARQEEVLADLQLDPAKPYLFFGMSSPMFAPREIDIVEWLADQVNSNQFGPDMQLVVRPHPQNVTGFMADVSWLPRLEQIRSPRVALNMPELSGGSLSWGMKQHDLSVLVNLMAGCSVCLNSGSTLSIDALMHRKPVVLTFFDADEQLPWWQSARRIKEFPHYRKLLETGGVQPVHSFPEVAAWIQAYVQDPELHSESRRSAISRECGSVDGQAAVRVAAGLESILDLERSKQKQATSHCDAVKNS